MARRPAKQPATLGRPTVMVGCVVVMVTGLQVPPPVMAGESADMVKVDMVDMVKVPAGFFTMGSEAGDRDEKPVRRVWVDAFAIDRTEVTRQHYLRCVRANACAAARPYVGLEDPLLPAVGVSWYDARRYCGWRAARLPTEAEWERAARGIGHRRYPWGNERDCSRANFGNFQGAGPCASANPGRIVPVGGFAAGASPVGALDMGGNAWEWVADWYGPYEAGQVRNPRGSRRGSQRVLRGGGCCSYFAMPRVTNRHRLVPGIVDRDIGFRCARSLAREQSQ